MSNDVVNVAIIDQDVTEPAVNMGDVCSRKTVDVFCAWVFFFFYSYFTQVYSAQLPATREKKMVRFVFYCVCNEMQLDFCYWLVKSDLVHTALKIHTIMHFLVDVCQSAHPR